MKPSTVIIGIILFAIVTMIIYGWGIVKQKNQTKDLMNLLFSKGQDKNKKVFKNRMNTLQYRKLSRFVMGLKQNSLFRKTGLL